MIPEPVHMDSRHAASFQNQSVVDGTTAALRSLPVERMGTAQAFAFDRELESLVRPIFRPATVGIRGPFAYRVGHPNSRFRHEFFV